MKQQEFFSSTPSLISVRDFPKLLRTNYGFLPEHVQPDMRFKAKTGLERVFDSIKENAAIIEESEGLDKYTEFEKTCPKEFGDNASRSFEGNKTCTTMNTTKCKVNMISAARKLRPTLHNKTHFQAVLALVHKQSKSLAQPKNRRPVAGSLEIEDAFSRVNEQLKKQEMRVEVEPEPQGNFVCNQVCSPKKIEIIATNRKKQN